jgi:aminopeptidase S
MINAESATRGFRGRCTLMLVFAAVLAGCTTTPAPPALAPGNGPTPPLVAGVSGAGAVPHLEALQRIADANGGNRASSEPGYEASVDYVADVLRHAGYDVSTPTYPLDVEDEEGGERTVELRQVVAQTRTGDPGRVVMAGAHLDSVPNGPGINDNASGVGVLLEVATRLGGSPQVVNAVRFAFWGSEEDDLEGSTTYVEALSDAGRQDLLLYLNLDMLASPNAGYFVQGGDGDGPLETGPPGSAQVAQVLTDQLAAVDVTADATAFDESSDYAAFVTAGVPSAGALTGDEDHKSTSEAGTWGGRAGEAYDPCYHSGCDRLHGLDRTALDRFTRAVAGTVSHFALSADPLP